MIQYDIQPLVCFHFSFFFSQFYSICPILCFQSYLRKFHLNKSRDFQSSYELDKLFVTINRISIITFLIFAISILYEPSRMHENHLVETFFSRNWNSKFNFCNKKQQQHMSIPSHHSHKKIGLFYYLIKQKLFVHTYALEG